MSPRIGIVGAGPGGLSLARLLTERGFADVTVIERAERVGGKSLTVTHQGLGHELGTCYVALGYTTVRQWMEEAGIGEFILKQQRVERADGGDMEFKDFVVGDAGMIGAGLDIARYLREWLTFHDWDLRGCPDGAAGTKGRSMRDEVAEPFGAWLAARGLDVLARFALRSMTAMGYGALDRVPALYGLRWNVPSLLWTAETMHIVEPVPGWQPLWTAIANQLDVRLSHTITAVERKRGGFLVHTDRGDLAFDHLVLTGPLDEAARWFPFTEADRASIPIDQIRYHEYVTTLVDASGWFKDSDTRAWEARLDGDAAVSRGQVVVARRTGDKTAVARSRSATRPDVYVCYQYGNPAESDAEQQARVAADLGRDGARVNEVLRHCRWRYAPQLPAEAIRGGALSRLERYQGTGNLWISGASASHEAVDNIVDYNERLAERMAIAFEGGEPSSEETIGGIADRLRFAVGDK